VSVRVGKALPGQELQHFAFLSRLFRSAGYAGWLILFDEGEIISRYSLRQRAVAYANLAQLFGYGSPISGLATVLTITDDYDSEVLYGRKNDLENIPAKVSTTREANMLPLAEKGMEIIRYKKNPIAANTPDQVNEIYRRVRMLYSAAYNWEAPELEQRREFLPSDSMRIHIRSWITAWDFRRLYDTQVSLVTDDVSVSLEEDADMQTNSDDDEPSITL
jgi:hypothetical protein